MPPSIDDNGEGKPEYTVILDTDSNPVQLDDNPANIEGVLDAVDSWIKRTGNYSALLQQNAKLLSNGKLVVESLDCIQFIEDGGTLEGKTYGFSDPCPNTAARIATATSKADAADAALPKGSAVSPRHASLTALPPSMRDQYIVQPLLLRTESQAFAASLAGLYSREHSDLATELLNDSDSDGLRALALLRSKASAATAADHALVKINLTNWGSRGFAGPLTLETFNAWYKEYNKRWIHVRKTARPEPVEVIEVINTLILVDSTFAQRWELRMDTTLVPHANDKSKWVSELRNMLRNSKVHAQLADAVSSSHKTALVANSRHTHPHSPTPDTPNTPEPGAKSNLFSPKNQVKLAALVCSGDVKGAKAFVARSTFDPAKTNAGSNHNGGGGGGGKANGSPNGSKKTYTIPRDKDGNINGWVEGMPPCFCVSLTQCTDGGKHPHSKCPFPQFWKDGRWVGEPGAKQKGFIVHQGAGAEMQTDVSAGTPLSVNASSIVIDPAWTDDELEAHLNCLCAKGPLSHNDSNKSVQAGMMVSDSDATQSPAGASANADVAAAPAVDVEHEAALAEIASLLAEERNAAKAAALVPLVEAERLRTAASKRRADANNDAAAAAALASAEATAFSAAAKAAALASENPNGFECLRAPKGLPMNLKEK